MATMEMGSGPKFNASGFVFFKHSVGGMPIKECKTRAQPTESYIGYNVQI
jgi:hypothetical protein